jgi:choice-of-anchor C domain-containing protein
LVLLALGAVANAAPFTNGSFETGPAAGSFLTLGSGNASITGWTVGGVGVDYIGTYWQAEEGTRSLDLSSTGAGSISQTFDTILNRVYSVNFWLAGNPTGGPAIKTLRVSAPASQQEYTFNTTGRSRTAMGWVEHEFLFTAASTSTTLTFASLNSTAYGPTLDNVSVTPLQTIVPEPSTWMLLGGGLIAVALRRKALGRS